MYVCVKYICIYIYTFVYLYIFQPPEKILTICPPTVPSNTPTVVQVPSIKSGTAATMNKANLGEPRTRLAGKTIGKIWKIPMDVNKTR